MHTRQIIPFLAILLAACTATAPSPESGSGTATGSARSLPSFAYALYFDNTELNPEALCTAAFPVTRSSMDEETTATETLRMLLAGPTPSEKEDGYTSFFSEETADALIGMKVENGTAYVNLRDLRQVIPNASSSCGSTALLTQLRRTLTQYGDIYRVILAFEGSTQDFYDWLQLGCSPQNDDCNDEPFIGL